jgi:16S rRNA (cytidine1402-2'-O)-methyltransferase
VLIVESAPASKASDDWEAVLSELLAEMPLARAVKLVCKLTGAKKNTVYARALSLAGKARN